MRFNMDVTENDPDGESEDNWSLTVDQRRMDKLIAALLIRLAIGNTSSAVITLTKERGND